MALAYEFMTPKEKRAYRLSMKQTPIMSALGQSGSSYYNSNDPNAVVTGMTDGVLSQNKVGDEAAKKKQREADRADWEAQARAQGGMKGPQGPTRTITQKTMTDAEALKQNTDFLSRFGIQAGGGGGAAPPPPKPPSKGGAMPLKNREPTPFENPFMLGDPRRQVLEQQDKALHPTRVLQLAPGLKKKRMDDLRNIVAKYGEGVVTAEMLRLAGVDPGVDGGLPGNTKPQAGLVKKLLGPRQDAQNQSMIASGDGTILERNGAKTDAYHDMYKPQEFDAGSSDPASAGMNAFRSSTDDFEPAGSLNAPPRPPSVNNQRQRLLDDAAKRESSRESYPQRRLDTVQDVLQQAQNQRQAGIGGDPAATSSNNRAQRLAENDVVAAGGQVENPFFINPGNPGERLGGNMPDYNIPGSGNNRMGGTQQRFDALGGGSMMGGGGAQNQQANNYAMNNNIAPPPGMMGGGGGGGGGISQLGDQSQNRDNGIFMKGQGGGGFGGMAPSGGGPRGPLGEPLPPRNQAPKPAPPSPPQYEMGPVGGTPSGGYDMGSSNDEFGWMAGMGGSPGGGMMGGSTPGMGGGATEALRSYELGYGGNTGEIGGEYGTPGGGGGQAQPQGGMPQSVYLDPNSPLARGTGTSGAPPTQGGATSNASRGGAQQSYQGGNGIADQAFGIPGGAPRQPQAPPRPPQGGGYTGLGMVGGPEPNAPGLQPPRQTVAPPKPPQQQQPRHGPVRQPQQGGGIAGYTPINMFR